jgi:signal transduction histidine kinase
VPGWQLVYATARDVTRQKRLEREILEIADRQQERLGRELHDGLCQTLAGIAALSAALSRRLAARADSDASAAAAEITVLLNEAIGEAHDLAHGLGPMGLHAAGLAGALEGLALTVQHRFRVACTLECEAPFPRLGHEVEAHLFRIAQEAVNNAVTHARTERIEISLRGTDGEGRLRVRDNGVGLSDEALRGDGIGRHTMAYRAHLIGGSLEVRQCTPAGTAVTCVFPLPETPDSRENLGHTRTDS